MPKLLPIQHTFDAGEISPLLLARSDLAIYKRGVTTCRNMLPRSQGPMMGRGGFSYFNSLIGTTGRTFSFQESWDAGFPIAISDDGNLYVSDDIGQAFGPDVMLNGNFENGLDSWHVTYDLGSVSVVDGFLELESNVAAAKGWVQVSQQVNTGLNSALVHNVIVNMPDDDSEVIEVRIGTAIGLGDILTLSGGSTQLSGNFTPNASHFHVTLWKNGGVGLDGTKRIDVITVRATLPSTGMNSFAHPWTHDLQFIHAKMPPGDNVVYFTHPNFPPQVLEHIGAGSWSFGAITFTAAPASWTGTSYPRSLAFFQGRSWWGGPGSTFYGSKSGIPLNLTTGTADDDGFEFKMAERGEIMWFASLRNLLLGTRTGEHIITSEGGVITPSDINVEQQSAIGSNFCQPVKVGSKAIYVTADGRRVHDIGYQWTAEQWLSTDITFSAEHLTVESPIKEITWHHRPTKTLGCVLTDGTMMTCLYDTDKEIIGWSLFETEGFIHSISMTEKDGIYYFVALVDRYMVDGSSNALLNVEILGGQIFLDASKEEYSATPKDTIDDGVHLAGRVVGVKIDGALHPDVTLDASGEADLEWSGNYIGYGLHYQHKLVLLPRDFPYESGSTSSLKKRWNKIWVRVLASVLPVISDSISADRTPQTPMNQPEPVRSHDIQVSTLGFSRGSITITNDLPFPLNVIGVFGEMGVSKIG